MMNEMKNTIESFNSRPDQMEERICELKYRSLEIFQSRGKRTKKTEENLCDSWGFIK